MGLPPLQHKTIESVLERGEKLNDLVDRSNALSAQSKMFYKTAKKVRSVVVMELHSNSDHDFWSAAKLVLCADVDFGDDALTDITIVPPART